MTDSINSEPIPSLSNAPCPSNSPQPRKLRDSCNHCAISKVKCNKEKPICSRCVRRRLPCEYKVSRRTGRTSRAANHLYGTATENSTASPALQPTNISNSTSANVLSTPFDTSGSSQTPLLTPSTAVAMSLPSPEHRVPESSDIWQSFLSPSEWNDDLSSIMALTADVGDIFVPVTESPKFIQCDIETLQDPGLGRTASNTNDSFLPTPTVSEVTSVAPWATTFSPPTCCLNIMLDILTSLVPSVPATCNYPGIQPRPCRGRTIDSVVSENRRIIESIGHVLDCSCSHDPYVISIVALAIFKVMGWYIAAARSPKSTLDHGREWRGAISPLPNISVSSTSTEHVLHLPTVVGSYSIGGRNQNRMAAQLVLGELHRVQRLVNALCSRLESIQLRNCHSSAPVFSSSSTMEEMEDSLVAAAQVSPLSSSTFSHLEDDLRQHLRAISAEIIEILRRA
ncbi:hypothetical protein BDV12DRAFT_131209 [Aspergillus spectabilis]